MDLKPIIFSKFGVRDAVLDIIKDADGKGVVQRYNELLAGDYDDNIGVLLENLVKNTIDPDIVSQDYLTYLEYQLGVTLLISNDLVIKRKIVKLINFLYDIKGTIKGYEVLLKMLGFKVVQIIEHHDDGGLDSPGTLDDDDRKLDSNCPPCTRYDIKLYDSVGSSSASSSESGSSCSFDGDVTVDSLISNFITNIIIWNEPINAILGSITYNDCPLVQVIITVFVDENGDLIYNNDFDPFLILELVDGDLIVSGPNADKYSMNANGDLIYTIS